MSSATDHPNLTDDQATLDEALTLWERGAPTQGMLPRESSCGLTFTEMNVICAGCKEDLPMSDSRLVITEHPNGVEVWEQVGFCRPCRTLTTTLYRFRPDGRFETIKRNQWRQGTISKATPAWWDMMAWGRRVYRAARAGLGL